MKIRLMNHEDIPFALSLTDSLNWGNTKDEFERLLSVEPEGCFIAEVARERTGMVTSVSYGEVGWIGNVVVIPEYRNKGMGTKLMLQAMDYLKGKGAETIELEAEQRPVALYKRLGFKELCKSLRFSGTGKIIEAHNINLMQDSNLDDVLKLDKETFGANRGKALNKAYQQFSHLCFVSYKSQELIGYIMAKERKGLFQIGPWICQPEYMQEAEELLKAVLYKLRGEKIKIGVLELNNNSLTILKKYQYKEIEPAIRMFYGKRKEGNYIQGEFATGAHDKG